MKSMTIICDYALVSPDVVMYKVEHTANVFTTYEDIDEDCFRLNIFPMEEVISPDEVLPIAEAIKPYLFDE